MWTEIIQKSEESLIVVGFFLIYFSILLFSLEYLVKKFS